MFKCNVTVRILRPEYGADGEVSYTEFTTDALRIERRERRHGDLPPTFRECTEFLIPPPAEVRPGDLLCCDGERFELDDVRVCRNLDGTLVAHRCQIAHHHQVAER